MSSTGNSSSISKMLTWHDRSFLLVMIYAMIRQSVLGFDRVGAHDSSYPFYIDHTIFGAALTFFLIRQVGLLIDPIRHTSEPGKRFLHFVIVAGTIAVALLIHGRGTWMALGSVCLIWIFAKSRSFLHPSIPIGLLALAFIFLYERSSSTTASQEFDSGLKATFRSITNFSTDTSNKERLIRWKAAWSGVMQRPVLGHGPGTYQFHLPSFLTPEEKAAVPSHRLISDDQRSGLWSNGSLLIPASAQAAPANGGTAHSEYLLALFEKGILGGLWWICAAGFFLVLTVSSIHQRRPTMIIVAGLVLVAYLIHGLVNNFLDDCKIASLFWSHVALICGGMAVKIKA